MKRRPWTHLFALLISIIFVLPLYLAVVNVFKELEQIRYHPMALPRPFTLTNLSRTITRPDRLLFEGLANSLLVTSLSVVVLVCFSSVIGYVIARRQRRLMQLLLLLFIAGLLIPPPVTLIPVTRILRALGLMGTYPGLILLFAGGGLLSFAVFVFSGFVKTIPREFDEAAIIDGAGGLTLFWLVIFPLMRPATATVTIYLSLWTWNEFLMPLIVLGPSQGITITTGIYTAIGTYTSDYGQIFALMLLSAVPMLVFFFLLQREFISGLTSGAFKG